MGVLVDRILIKRFKKYAGVLEINKDESEKELYSLILEDDPQTLETQKEIAFKVVILEKTSNLEQSHMKHSL